MTHAKESKEQNKVSNEYIISRILELERLFPPLTITPLETSGTPAPTRQTETTVFRRRFISVEETSVTEPSEDRLWRLESLLTYVARYVVEQTRNLNSRITNIESALEDIGSLRGTIKRRINREEALTLLKERLKTIPLPNLEVQLLKTDPAELRVRVIIDDTEKYFELLEEVANVVGELHRKYDLETEIMLFQRSELLGIEGDVEETISMK